MDGDVLSIRHAIWQTMPDIQNGQKQKRIFGGTPITIDRIFRALRFTELLASFFTF